MSEPIIKGQTYRHKGTGEKVVVTGLVGKFVQFNSHMKILRVTEFTKKYELVKKRGKKT